MQGDDGNGGTYGAPVRTLERAVEIAGAQREEIDSDETIDIYLRGGVYYLQSTVRLSSWNGDVPLKISAYRNEKVRLTGGVDIPLSAMETASDSFVSQVIDKPETGKILQYDLTKSGITDYGTISRRGHIITANQVAQAEVSLNGTMQQLAAWPNKDFVGLKEIKNAGKRTQSEITKGCSFTVDFDRPSQWSDQKNVWLSGTIAEKFFNDYYPMQSFDVSTKTITLREGAVEKNYAEPFFRFENIPEELDAPGEYYIDRTNGMLYFYPPDGTDKNAKLTVTMTPEDLIRIENSNNITLENLTLDNGRKSAVTGKNTKDITVKNCDIYAFGEHGIRLTETVRARIEGCRIHDVGQNGVMLRGGDVGKVISSENVVYNNDIYRFARLERGYRSGVNIERPSVGVTVERNHIHDGPHAGLIYYGVNHKILGNEIDNVVKECHDMGAVYAYVSDDPWERGNIIQGNYFHDLGQQRFVGQRQMNVCAVYNDNKGSGLTVTENLFYNIGTERSNSVCGVLAQGTYNKINRNLFVDCSGTYYGNSTYNPDKKYYELDEDGNPIDVFIKDVGVQYSELKKDLDAKLPVYKEYFPELERFWQEHPSAVTTNEFIGNMVVNINASLSEIDPDRNEKGFRGAVELVKAENNQLAGAECKNCFRDYDNGDFSVVSGANGLPDGFPNIQMSNFGLVNSK